MAVVTESVCWRRSQRPRQVLDQLQLLAVVQQPLVVHEGRNVHEAQVARQPVGRERGNGGRRGT